MAKLEEIAELLTEEIQEFNKSVHKLEQLSKNFKDIKVKADTTQINYLLERYFQQEEQVQSTHNEKLKEVRDKVDKAYILPRWLVVSFFVMFAIILLSTGFAIYFQRQNSIHKQKQKTVLRHYQGFMEEVPQAKILYEKWQEGNNRNIQ